MYSFECFTDVQMFIEQDKHQHTLSHKYTGPDLCMWVSEVETSVGSPIEIFSLTMKIHIMIYRKHGRLV